MTTYYLNPSATYNGNGTASNDAASGGASGAFNTLVGFTMTSSDSLAIKSGTTAVLAVSDTSQRILLGSTGNFLTTYGGNAPAILDSTSCSSSPTYAIRTQGTRNYVDNIKVITGPALTMAIQVGSGSDDVAFRNFELVGCVTSSVTTNCAISIGTAHKLTIENFVISKFNTGITGGWPSDTDGRQIIRNGIIKELSGQYALDSDGITIGGTIYDHKYNTLIENIDISGFYENGLDLVNGKNIVVKDLYIHDPSSSTAVGVLMGSSSGTSGGGLLYRVKSVGGMYGFAARGGPNNTLISCIGYGSTNGLTISGGSAPNNNKAINCTFGTNGAGNGVRIGIDVSSSGHEFTNCIFESASGNGLSIDSGSTCTVTNCASNVTVYGGAGVVTNGGNNLSSQTLDATLSYLPITSNLVGTGKYMSMASKSFTGKKFYNPPSIGAYEATRKRSAR